MKIPKRFQLFGRTISVHYDPHLLRDKNALGLASYDNDTITIQPNTAATQRPREQIEHVYLHELVHHLLLHAAGCADQPPLHEREDLVDRLSGLLHQALTTAEYK